MPWRSSMIASKSGDTSPAEANPSAPVSTVVVQFTIEAPATEMSARHLSMSLLRMAAKREASSGLGSVLPRGAVWLGSDAMGRRLGLRWRRPVCQRWWQCAGAGAGLVLVLVLALDAGVGAGAGVAVLVLPVPET